MQSNKKKFKKLITKDERYTHIRLLFWSFIGEFMCIGASLKAQSVKNLPATQETQVWFLGWEDPLERKWQSTPELLLGESHGQRHLAGLSGSQESLYVLPSRNFYLTSSSLSVFFFFFMAELGLICSKQKFSCGLLDLILWPGIKPRAPVLRAQTITTRSPGKSQLVFKVCVFEDVSSISVLGKIRYQGK